MVQGERFAYINVYIQSIIVLNTSILQCEVDICWSVHDLDSSQSINVNSDPVSSRILPVPPLEPGNTTEELHFDTSNAHILLRFRLVCEDPDSVSDCSGPCVPTDNSTGHFTCDPDTGERVCLDGYNDTWSRCTVCIPSAGCSEF
jgi:hypothetical protein